MTLLHLAQLSDDERAAHWRLGNQLRTARFANRRQLAYYEGSRLVRQLDIAVPPHLRDLEAVTAWPEIVVDVLDERLDWRGWFTRGADLGLDGIYDDNNLGAEVGQAVLDALICGVAFFIVGTGDPDAGEPEVLITGESPNRVTGTWNARLRRLVEALAENYDDDGVPNGFTYYTPDETVRVERGPHGERVVERDRHELGRVPVAVMRNRPRSSRVEGRSEITRAVRSLTDAGVRTLLRMEVTAEFYSAPQRYLMGADEGMFVDAEGRKRTTWDAVIGHMLTIPRDEEGQVPTVGQFAAASPQPHTDQLRTLAQMVSAASGVPAPHLGFTTDSNPASADAIRETNTRLDKRAIRRQGQYDKCLNDVAALSLLWRDGTLPASGTIASHWTDPSTPTPAASADRAIKLVSAGIWLADSDVTLEQVGMSASDIERIKADRRRGQPRTVENPAARVVDLTQRRAAG